MDNQNQNQSPTPTPPESYAEQLARQDQEASILPMQEAEIVAYAAKANRDQAAEMRQDAAAIEGHGLISAMHRYTEGRKAKELDKNAAKVEQTVEEHLGAYTRMKEYAPAHWLYEQAIGKAEKMRDKELTAELRADMERDGVKSYEHAKQPERSIFARTVETAAMALADPDKKAVRGVTLTGGQYANFLVAQKACKLIGLELDTQKINEARSSGHPQQLRRRFQTIRAGSSTMGNETNPTHALAVYFPSTTRTSGEDLVFEGDSIAIRFSKDPIRISF
jgi:hypothetical protein